MRKVSAVFWLVVIACCPQGASAATRYVRQSAPDGGDGSSSEMALQTIQQGIDASLDGDTVVVAEGTYVENLQLKGKNIVLRSVAPSNPEVVRRTIIDGNQADSVVSFSGTEGSTCVLEGFTIQNGKADYGGGVRGGIQERQTSATIRNNIITRNRADLG